MLANWLSALGTLSAAVIAMFIAIRDGRQRDRERRDLEAAQARTVFATVEMRRAAIRDFGAAPRPHVVVHNHGTAPITRVLLQRVSASVGGTHLRQWRFDEPEHDVDDMYRLCLVLPPGAEAASPGCDHGRRGKSRACT